MSCRSVAFHEAGHAVVMQAHGVRCLLATIVPDQGYLGHVNEASGAWASATVEARVSVLFAGIHSAARAAGCRPRLLLRGVAKSIFKGDLLRYGAVQDCWDAWRVAGRVAPSTRERIAYLRWISERAAAEVEERWPEVEAVAAALLEQRTLTGAEVRRIIGRARREAQRQAAKQWTAEEAAARALVDAEEVEDAAIIARARAEAWGEPNQDDDWDSEGFAASRLRRTR